MKTYHNDVYIDENQISSVYGRKNLANYLARNNFDLVYEKRGAALNPGVQFLDIGSSSNDDATQNAGNVNTKYSISDTDGKQLSKGQQDYFKDSKVRDENGNLKVMYHGSQDAGFHEFNGSRSDDGISFFFVDRNDVASS